MHLLGRQRVHVVEVDFFNKQLGVAVIQRLAHPGNHPPVIGSHLAYLPHQLAAHGPRGAHDQSGFGNGFHLRSLLELTRNRFSHKSLMPNRASARLKMKNRTSVMAVAAASAHPKPRRGIKKGNSRKNGSAAATYQNV